MARDRPHSPAGSLGEQYSLEVRRVFVGGGATELLKRVTRDCAQVLHDAEVVIQVVACDADAEGEDAR